MMNSQDKQNETVAKGGRRVGRPPLVPDRIRSIAGGGFAFVPNRFLLDGFFRSLTPDELLLYFLLVLAGDRSGMSFYHYDSLCSLLRMPVERYIEARNGLIAKDLIAFDGVHSQVLSLPMNGPRAPRPLCTIEELEMDDPATIRCLAEQSLGKR